MLAPPSSRSLLPAPAQLDTSEIERLDASGEPALDDACARSATPAPAAALRRDVLLPVASWIAGVHAAERRPLLVGIAGAQGSGKSTWAAWLCTLLHAGFGLRATSVSIDDFYLTASERARLAREVHPLLATRGVPGTHDVALTQSTLDALLHGTGDVLVPVFDKGTDDRAPRERWRVESAPLDVVLWEGWCVGARPAGDVAEPINDLERQEDPDGTWRRYVDEQLSRPYAALFDSIGARILLAAPSFDVVAGWRQEQERTLRAAGAPRAMSDAEIVRFVSHFERVTRSMLRRGGDADVVVELDAARNVRALRSRDA